MSARSPNHQGTGRRVRHETTLADSGTIAASGLDKVLGRLVDLLEMDGAVGPWLVLVEGHQEGTNVGVRFSVRGFRYRAGAVGVWLVLASSSPLLTLSGCGKPVDHPEIRAVLGKQEQAWNRGDLDGFMQGYWKSDELVFSSPKGQTRGWQAVLEQYRQSYSTRERMGQLAFEELQIARPGEDQAEVSGKYRLKHPAGPQAGRFYLYLRRIDNAWVIVRDYTVDG